ncbi:hypothetical protein I302_108378 [Kwoniella bestiolae CBS 10118]|uniref:Uncharacterized protein n=1 Tax=Kwoniella bestiolae CBS 10118 TaxID=1296100 RepID=A0A1B9FVX1_9TREE|nr:hypothetical protein I302_07248 [Kwoniella bestiolae CBS 10118]OCF22901.1 hypothetical protein I302_07248 [Kwoniella bestiolae CBS 10118]
MPMTKMRPSMHLALPPRIAMTRTDSDDSAPSTPGPHTPLPYESNGYFSAPLVSCESMNLDEASSVGVGSKRSRDEEDERFVEPEWTEEEIDVIQSTLIHPFRPISTSYPPGELPPPKVLDELTNQVLNYAFRHSCSSSSPVEPSSSSPEPEKKWSHSWDATHKKLFEIALNESKSAFGFDNIEEKKKLTREERVNHSGHRPGLRRVDSMDFLNQNDGEGEEKKSENVGRAIRLSTSLQNSAKQEPLLLSLTRSTSVGSGLIADSPLYPPGPSVPPAPPIAAITLTPASPTGPSPKSQPLRRKPSLRNLSARPSRPTSLLQRGRSFTAEDLRAEAESPPASDDQLPSSDCHDTDNPIISPTSSEMVTSPISMISQPLPLLKPSSSITGSTKLTRSHSSSSTLYSQPHAVQKAFLQNPKPSTTDRSQLALPLPISDEPAPARASSNGWSDSEDESVSKRQQPRKIKKLKQSKNKLELGGGIRGPAITSQQMLLPDFASSGGGLGLRSPFEEKDEPQFI